MSSDIKLGHNNASDTAIPLSDEKLADVAGGLFGYRKGANCLVEGCGWTSGQSMGPADLQRKMDEHKEQTGHDSFQSFLY